MPLPRTHQRVPRRGFARIDVALLILGLLVVGVFALSIQRSIAKESARSDSNSQLASTYQNARFWVGQEESLERKYRLEPTSAVLRLHSEAERGVTVYLGGVTALEGSPSTRRFVSRLLQKNAEYAAATRSMFAAVLANKERLVLYYDHVVTDPIFTALQVAVYGRAATAADDAVHASASLKRHESAAFRAGIIVLVLVLVLVVGLMLVIRRGRLEQGAMRAAELERLRWTANTAREHSPGRSPSLSTPRTPTRAATARRSPLCVL
jgi:hypothetical protein